MSWVNDLLSSLGIPAGAATLAVAVYAWRRFSGDRPATAISERTEGLSMTALDDNSNPSGGVYEDRLLAFFDILGFSKWIDESIKDGNKATKILNLLTALSKMSAQFQTEDMSITLFSDTLCLSYHMPPNFATFCCGLSLVVTSLLGQGYAVRGAVVRGQLYHKGNVIFGPGLVRAYGLEQRLALFPRIIIDPLLVLDLSNPNDAAFEPVFRDHDGLQCVNFLSPVLLHVIFRLMDMPAEPLISDILDNIERLVSETSDQVALQKLRWLRSYASLTLSGPKPNDLLIDGLVRQIRRSST
jgi:hypothetical protein